MFFPIDVGSFRIILFLNRAFLKKLRSKWKSELLFPKVEFMAQIKFFKMATLIAICITAVMANTANADKPQWSDGDKYEKQQGSERHRERGRHGYHYSGGSNHDQDRSHYSGGRYFSDSDRVFLNGYFANEYRIGRCPPGLEKKNNGCLPPGHAKKWAVGQPIPPDAVYYDLPPDLMRGIGVPPPGYRFIRVASDILLIGIGTGMVMDAIYDLGLR